MQRGIPSFPQFTEVTANFWAAECLLTAPGEEDFKEKTEGTWLYWRSLLVGAELLHPECNRAAHVVHANMQGLGDVTSGVSFFAVQTYHDEERLSSGNRFYTPTQRRRMQSRMDHVAGVQAYPRYAHRRWHYGEGIDF